MGIFANGIVSEGQLHENNTGASSLRSRKVKLEDDVMQVYEDKTKQ